METVQSMNGEIWVFAALLIAMVIIQAVIFLRLALNFNKKHHLVTPEELNQSYKTGIISSIGPAFNTIIVAMSLIVLVGSATTFMRCGVIGAPTYELMMASLSAQTIGVDFNTPEFTQAVFTLCIFGMTMASIGYFIVTIVALKPLDKVSIMSSKKSKSGRNVTSYMGSGAMMATIASLFIDYTDTVPRRIALVCAGLVCYAVMEIARKTGNRTLQSFSMSLGMVAGMVVGQVVTSMAA